MLMPKKVKFRKQQRGRMAGKAWRGSDVSFGDYGLKTLEPCWLTDQLFRLRIQKSMGQLETPGKIAVVRRDLARVKTVLQEKTSSRA